MRLLIMKKTNCYTSQVSSDKSGIDLETAYKILIKAFLRKQLRESMNKMEEDTHALYDAQVPEAEHKIIEHSPDRNQTSTG